MKRNPFGIGFVLALTLVGSTALAETLQVSASKDNTLYEVDGGVLSNGAGSHFFVGRTGPFDGTLRRGVIAFDIAGDVPEGAQVLSVTLTLNMSKTIVGPKTITVHRLAQDWGEAGSNAGGEEGGGDFTDPGDASWIHTFFPGLFWTSPGGDFEPIESATQSVAGEGSYSWTGDGLVADVQAWLDEPDDNFGWILIGEEGGGTSSKRFDTRENLNAPVLTVEISAQPVPAMTSAGFAVLLVAFALAGILVFRLRSRSARVS